MTLATEFSSPKASMHEHISMAIMSVVSKISDFRSARKSMAVPGKLTTRQLESTELNGHNIELLALRIGYGV